MQQLFLLSFLFAPSLASINLPKHVSVRELPRRRMTSSFSKTTVKRTPLSGASSNARGRHSTAAAFIDPSSMAAAVGSFYQTSPYLSSFLTCAVKGIAADLVAQKQSASKQQKELEATTTTIATTEPQDESSMQRGGAAVISSSIDMKRMLAFLLYSGIYQGMCLNLIYNTVIPKLFGPSVIKNVLFSMFVVSPFLTLPIAYLFKALVFSHSPVAALQQYWSDIRHENLLKIYWTIWIPVQTVAFALVPQHLRISFIAAISFLWMIIFSSISSK